MVLAAARALITAVYVCVRAWLGVWVPPVIAQRLLQPSTRLTWEEFK